MIWTTQPRSKVGTLAAITQGRGPQVLMIHGVGLCADAWAGQISDLAQRFRITAVDMPGHGQSAPLPDQQANLRDYTTQIANLITEPTVVIGHSMGAMIAVDLAAHSSNVVGVAALNAIYQRSTPAWDAVKARANALSDTEISDPSPTLTRWFSDLTAPEAVACGAWLTQISPKHYKTAYQVFAHENGPSLETLRALRCPAMFMTGAQEPNSTPAMSRAMADLAPDGQAVIIEGAAHMLPMTHREEVNTHLISFAERCLHDTR